MTSSYRHLSWRTKQLVQLAGNAVTQRRARAQRSGAPFDKLRTGVIVIDLNARALAV